MQLKIYLFKAFDCSRNCEFLRILDGNVHNQLKILAIMSQHILHASKSPFWLNISKEVDQPGSWNDLSVQNNSTDIFNVAVVFQCSLEELLSFTESSDLQAIVLVPFSEIEYGIDNVWLIENIPLEDLCLPRTIFRSVRFHAVNEECTHFLEFACLTEDFSN